MRKLHLHSLWCTLVILVLSFMAAPHTTMAQDAEEDDDTVYSRRTGDGTLVFSRSPDEREIEIEVVGEVHLKGGVGMASVADMPESQDVWDELIARWAKDRGLPFELVKAVIRTESAMIPAAKSHAGALGLMQLMPATARGLGLHVNGSVDERLIPERNIWGGTLYLQKQFKRFNTGTDHFNNLEAMIGAYNAGPGAIREVKRGELHVRWVIPTNGETEGYVPTVIKYYRAYLEQPVYPGTGHLRPEQGDEFYPY